MAQFKLVFKEEIDGEEASAPLKKAIKDGELGSLKVQPDSLKATDDETPTDKGTNQMPLLCFLSQDCC